MDSVVGIISMQLYDFVDVSNLFDTCKAFKPYKYYKLNSEHSKKFYFDSEFRRKVESSVNLRQLSLNLSRSGIDCVSSLNNIHALNLSYCPVVDVSALTNVHTLILNHCPVSDVSMLGNTCRLSLEHCHKVTDVSRLGHVYYLSLMNCHGLVDISGLTRVSMAYWSSRDIFMVDQMLQHLIDRVKSDFYDIFNPANTPSIIETPKKTMEFGWWIVKSQIQVEKGWNITGKGFLLYFDEEQLLNWNGKYIPMSMGDVFSLGQN